MKDFDIKSWVILDDHCHFIINNHNLNISDVIHKFKIRYSRYYRDKYGAGRVWQNRFWDHVIRDQSDFNYHLDYIHYNPVKHSHINNPFDWEFSSINEYLEKGYYQSDWGIRDKVIFDGDFGE